MIKDMEKDPDNLCVLMWDANESVDDSSGSTKKLMRETKLVDAFSQIAGDLGAIPTYNRGHKRIDYILTSQALLPYISRDGYLALYESNLLTIEVHLWIYQKNILDTKVTRYIGSKIKQETIYEYKNYIHKQFIIHRIYERAEEIHRQSMEGKVTLELIQRLNILDKQITEIMLAAEKHQCPQQHETDRSVAIHHQSHLCKYWAILVKGARNKINTNKQANEIFQHLPEAMQQEIQDITQYHHPMIIRQECYHQLQLATK
jgi:hypothetical protein